MRGPISESGARRDAPALATAAPRAWRPILDGAEAREAASSVREIAEAVRRAPGFAFEIPGIVRGAAGLSICFSYLGRCGLVDEAEAIGASLLEQARRLVIRTPGTLSLFSGLTGVGAASAYLAHPDAAASRLADTVDVVLLRALQEPVWTGGFDLLDGVTGLGVYALDRLPRDTAAALLVRVLDRLEERADATPETLAWRIPSGELAPDVRALHPEGYYDLGLAHGTPGVIAFLARCVHAGVEVDRARRMAMRALAWLDQRTLAAATPRVPNFFSPAATDRVFSRIAWCHGDPSLAVAWLTAGRLLALPEFESRALAMARDAADCPPAVDGIVDAGLCHGCSGVAHVLNRMAQTTGDAALESAARRWFVRLLAMRDPGREVAGYPMKAGPSNAMTWSAEPGVLFGAAGVALALAAAISEVPPDWDRTFLLSWPDAAIAP